MKDEWKGAPHSVLALADIVEISANLRAKITVLTPLSTHFNKRLTRGFLLLKAPQNASTISAGSKKTKGPRSRALYLFGGDEEDRTPDLRIANATLSQLSYVPLNAQYSI